MLIFKMQLFESIFSNIVFYTFLDYICDFYALLKSFICSIKKCFSLMPFFDNIIHILQYKLSSIIFIGFIKNKNDLYKILSNIIN